AFGPIDTALSAAKATADLFRIATSAVMTNNPYFSLADHLASAACLAISDRCLLESFAARALPPFKPPSLPSSTAL
ncbi:MAG: hypothetical protein KGK17_09285, partial [Betaproteobacteria bacterium]|nr:hypothetical protein [Betaproteobacteria bacterium]